MLDDKRTPLVRAFREGVEGAVAGSARLGQAAQAARRALALAEVRDGPELVRSAALAAPAEHALAVSTEHVLGVRYATRWDRFKEIVRDLRAQA